MSDKVDEANRAFWSELCGTTLARRIGVKDDSPDALARFDEWYFRFYPYLERYIPFDRVAGRRVLEVGLGYGSVAQRLAAAGAVYTGLDIADGPVAMVRRRLEHSGLQGKVYRGSILAAPFESASFDCVVAIGCFHHTGSTSGALAETHRLLAENGTATVMLYNAYSYRRWLRWPLRTATRWLRERGAGSRGGAGATASERSAYDTNQTGIAAPFTEFFSVSEVRAMAARYSSVQIGAENVDNELPGGLALGRRNWWLRALGPSLGLDLYVLLRK